MPSTSNPTDSTPQEKKTSQCVRYLGIASEETIKLIALVLAGGATFYLLVGPEIRNLLIVTATERADNFIATRIPKLVNSTCEAAHRVHSWLPVELCEQEALPIAKQEIPILEKAINKTITEHTKQLPTVITLEHLVVLVAGYLAYPLLNKTFGVIKSCTLAATSFLYAKSHNSRTTPPGSNELDPLLNPGERGTRWATHNEEPGGLGGPPLTF